MIPASAETRYNSREITPKDRALLERNPNAGFASKTAVKFPKSMWCGDLVARGSTARHQLPPYTGNQRISARRGATPLGNRVCKLMKFLESRLTWS